jgi:hypothetical protein
MDNEKLIGIISKVLQNNMNNRLTPELIVGINAIVSREVQALYEETTAKNAPSVDLPVKTTH